MIFFTTMMGLHLGCWEAFNSHALDIQISPEKVFQVYIYIYIYLGVQIPSQQAFGCLGIMLHHYLSRAPSPSLTNLEEAQAGIVPPSLVVCSVEKKPNGLSPTWGAGDCTNVFECLGSHNRDPNT